MNNLVYLLIGDNKKCQRELFYSLLSLDKTASQWTRENVIVTIYCDRAFLFQDLFKNLNIRIKLLGKEKIRAIIKSGNGFFLILKPWVIRDCLQEDEGNVLFVDIDTFFMRDPKPLFEQVGMGRLVLHLKEHSIRIRPKVRKYLKRSTFSLLNGEKYAISPKANMWNSGVVGINHDYLPLIDEISYLTKQISADRKWHIIEQFAFSYFFEKERGVVSSDDYIFHYWFCRPVIYLLMCYFNRNDEDRLEDIHPFLACCPVPEKISYEQIPQIIAKLWKQYAMANPSIFSCLPLQSFIGKLIRKEILKDPFFFMCLVYVEIKRFFHLDTLTVD